MDDIGPRCSLSHPGLPHHNLFIQCDRYLQAGCFTCGGKLCIRDHDYIQYYCTTCGVEFHENCHERPRRITHPYHLQHPLTLFYQNPETGVITNIIPDASPYESDPFVREGDDTSKFEIVDIVPSKSDIIFNICTWCGKDFKGDDWFYRCLICGFCLDLSCALTIPPLTIANPKSHQHSLLFLPRPLLVPCDACGLVDALQPSYACFQCNYMVHQNCVELPRVIKITRHPHRLCFIPYRSPLFSSCRICYKEVDIKYGQYSCNNQDCSYVVHSRCATHENVWDGTELEWETVQESQETDQEDIAPFRQLGGGFIKHFSHKHRLKLKKHDGVRDTEKICRACIYPIGLSPQFYHCRRCNYSLHEVCAGLSRKLDHALHNHTLILDPFAGSKSRSKSCTACSRQSTGFMYICSNQYCGSTAIDVGCILLAECFTHKSHKHPIFISTSYNSKDEILCKICKKRCLGARLQCTVCEEFAMCYTCATIPNEIHYRFDKHPLTLSCGESRADEDDMYWCEVCEKQLDTREWFYTCNKCCVTVHLQCIFGSSVFMRPGSIFRDDYGVVQVFRNSSNTRLFCYICHKRCISLIYYQGYRSNGTMISYNSRWTRRIVFCSLECEVLGMQRRHIMSLPW